MNNDVRILLADDHNIVLDGLNALLQDLDGVTVVGKCSNGKMVLEFLVDNEVDLILLDIDMPIVNGLEVAEIVTAQYPKTKIIALSMHNKLSYVKKMLQNGAMGYLLKSTTKQEIGEAIRSVISQNERYISPKLRKEILSDIFVDDTNALKKPPVVTKRERQVLDLIANEHTNTEISEMLAISVNTVEFHRKNLLNKFDVRNSVGLVRVAFRLGLLC